MKAWSFSWDSKNQGPRFAVKTLISDILKLISTISRSERNDTPTKSQPTKRSLDRSHCVLVNVLQESFHCLRRLRCWVKGVKWYVLGTYTAFEL